MTTTQEFCNTIKMEADLNKFARREEEEKKKHRMDIDDIKEEEISAPTLTKSSKKKYSTVESIGIKDETSIDTGMAAFIKLAKQKGVLDEKKIERELSVKLSKEMKEMILAKEDNYHAIEDKFRVSFLTTKSIYFF